VLLNALCRLEQEAKVLMRRLVLVGRPLVFAPNLTLAKRVRAKAQFSHTALLHWRFAATHHISRSVCMAHMKAADPRRRWSACAMDGWPYGLTRRHLLTRELQEHGALLTLLEGSILMVDG
jgi:hypothetical protein